MNTGRLRVRRDRFLLRGWEYPFHEIRDQGKMAALVPETDEPRMVTLWCGRTFECRKGDVFIIYPQIGWPLPGGLTAPPNVAEALERAAQKVDAFKAAAAAPAPPVSSVDDTQAPEVIIDVEPEVSHRLLVYRKQGESFRDFLSRLTPELEREFNKLTQLQLYGAGLAKLRDCLDDPEPSWANNPVTVSERHGEISGLLAELQRLGAEAEAKG